MVGQTIAGKYRIERLVGSGGMGAVYEALNLAINKRVALKFLFRDEAIDRDTAARFQREAEAASAVNSAHIVQIFDAGTSEDGRPYLVMELLEGEDLRHRLKRVGRLPLEEAVVIAKQLSRALGRAHAAGIIHRDLKPDNIFICPRDDDPLFVKILDFGISKIVSAHTDTLTRRGTVLGTAHYMSPEQAQAFADIDGRADLFSLGAILYEALAGRPPHLAKTFEAVLIRVCTTAADDIREHAPDVPEAIARVIAKSIERDREQRYQTAHDFTMALEQFAPELYHAPRRPDNLSASSAVPSQPAFADTEESQTPPVSTGSGNSLTRSTRVEGPSGSARPLTIHPPKRARLALLAALVTLPILGLAGWLAHKSKPARQNSVATALPALPAPGSNRTPAAEPRGAAAGRAAPSSSAQRLHDRTEGAGIEARPKAKLPATVKAPFPGTGAAIAPSPGVPASPSGVPASSGVAGQLRLKTEGP